MYRVLAINHPLVTATVVTVFYALLESISEHMAELVRIDHALVFGLSVLFVIDWITGVAASVKRKDKITSRKFGATVTKFLKYSTALLVAALLEGMFEATLFRLVTDYFTVFVAFYLSIVEGKSIIENTWGQDGAGKLFKGLKRLMRIFKPEDLEDILDDIEEPAE